MSDVFVQRCITHPYDLQEPRAVRLRCKGHTCHPFQIISLNATGQKNNSGNLDCALRPKIPVKTQSEFPPFNPLLNRVNLGFSLIISWVGLDPMHVIAGGVDYCGTFGFLPVMIS